MKIEQDDDVMTCARCDKPIKTVEPESTPAGSMHPRCARAYERQKPEDW